MSRPRRLTAPWTPTFELPPPPRTDRCRWVPLGPPVAELDYSAIMGSRHRLRAELRWGGWPPDSFTLADNRVDLAGHHAELERREAFAYSILDPTAARCLGCVYLEPWSPGAQLALWVVDEELTTGLEAHLLRTMAAWVEDAWPIDRVIVPLRPTNTRSQALVSAMGLPAADGPPDHVSFLLLGR